MFFTPSDVAMMGKGRACLLIGPFPLDGERTTSLRSHEAQTVMMELSPFLYGLYKLLKYGIYPLSWLLVLLGLLAALVTSPISPRRLRWIQYLTASSLLLLFGLGTPITSRLLVGLLEQQAPAFDPATAKRFDAIVVLGGGAVGKGTLRPSNELSPASMARTICGATLFIQGFAPRMIFSGGDASIFGQGPQEGAEMKRLALQLGVPEAATIVEDRSRTTYENAVETRRILGRGSILIVTSAVHVPRALGLFRKQGLDTTPYPCGYWGRDRLEDGLFDNPFDFIPEVESFRRSTAAIAEFVGLWVYRLSGTI